MGDGFTGYSRVHVVEQTSFVSTKHLPCQSHAESATSDMSAITA
jgi:hypothetical protein